MLRSKPLKEVDLRPTVLSLLNSRAAARTASLRH